LIIGLQEEDEGQCFRFIKPEIRHPRRPDMFAHVLWIPEEVQEIGGIVPETDITQIGDVLRQRGRYSLAGMTISTAQPRDESLSMGVVLSQTCHEP